METTQTGEQRRGKLAVILTSYLWQFWAFTVKIVKSLGRLLGLKGELKYKKM